MQSLFRAMKNFKRWSQQSKATGTSQRFNMSGRQKQTTQIFLASQTCQANTPSDALSLGRGAPSKGCSYPHPQPTYRHMCRHSPQEAQHTSNSRLCGFINLGRGVKVDLLNIGKRRHLDDSLPSNDRRYASSIDGQWFPSKFKKCFWGAVTFGVTIHKTWSPTNRSSEWESSGISKKTQQNLWKRNITYGARARQGKAADGMELAKWQLHTKFGTSGIVTKLEKTEV